MNIVIENKHFLIEIDKNAVVTKLVNKQENKSVLKERKSISTLVLNDRSELAACSASYKDGVLTVGFSGGFSADIKVEIFDDYFIFSLESVSTDDFWSFTFIDLRTCVAGSLFMTCGMGLTLNVKMGEYPGKNEKLSATVYTHIGYENAQFAVIGVDESQMNAIQRKIVDAIPFGQMPKGAYNGPYAKDCKDANRTYAIRVQPLTVENIDEYITMLEEFGVTQVNFHQSRMFRQGDFVVYDKECYPNGRKDLKRVVDRLHAKGMLASLHSYSFFLESYGDYKRIGSHYLQPIPHDELAVYKEYTLNCNLDGEQTELTVNECFDEEDAVFGFTRKPSPVLRIDNELLYITDYKEGKLFVERGAFGTIKAPHNSTANVKQLKAYFTYLMPKADSNLFFEIARNTADFYNECDFDAFYIDAIDGAGQFDGEEFSWYYGVVFANEVFKYIKKPCVFNCCYGPQYPGHWFARTLMGAFDTPSRGYRDFTDVHVDFNSKYAEKMGLVGELGWWQLYPYGQPVNYHLKVMWHEDIEYLMSKTLATDASLCWLSSFEHYKEIPLLASYRPIIKEYAALRDNRYFSKEIKDKLRKPQSEFHLCKDKEEYYFINMYTDRQRIESFEESRNILIFNNKFEVQTPKIRIEALWSAESYDSSNAKTIITFDEEKTVELDKKYDVTNPSTNKMRGMGVWICGDGKGEVVNIRLHSLKHLGTGYGDHFVKVDFTGWRYYSFYEFQNAEMKPNEYPVEPLNYKDRFEDVIPFYACYDPAVDM
ncbi:MAG: hypothetical protein J6I80_03210, partial [Clostridia bacterium]|nr:hypothetical protein [Clostridia bacterium]